jgi:hypothetical protein
MRSRLLVAVAAALPLTGCGAKYANYRHPQTGDIRTCAGPKFALGAWAIQPTIEFNNCKTKAERDGYARDAELDQKTN